MIEDIQKVNKLAQDLLDQGIIDSREDAVKKAQYILKKNIVDQKVSQQNSVEMGEESLEQYKNIIMRTKEYALRQLSMFRNDIQSLAQEVNKIKDELEALKNMRERKSAQEAGLNDIKTNEAADEKKEVQQNIETKKEEKGNPRSGDFNSSDVSIEKIFYCGDK